MNLSLKEMTPLDKLSLMEQLWDDLCSNPASIPSPEWHKDILQAREARVNEGKANFHSIEAAKKRIRDKIE
jgi:putative addiction module component (TIGR02574 family)